MPRCFVITIWILFSGVIVRPSQASPDALFEPNVPSEEGLFHFRKRIESTYQVYVHRMKAFLEEYSPGRITEGTNYYDCQAYPPGIRTEEEWQHPCWLDVAILSDVCISQTNFGFDDGQPCVAISLQPVMNWIPKSYENVTNVPEVIRSQWEKHHITIHCEPTDPVSRDNLVFITYYPATGLDFVYYPYIGQKNYVKPIMFVQLTTIPAVVVRVRCSAYAKNIPIGGSSTTFEVLSD